MPVPDAALPGGAETGDADGEGGAVRIAVHGRKGSDASASSDPGRPVDDPVDELDRDDPDGIDDIDDTAAETSLIDVRDVPEIARSAGTDAGADEPTTAVRRDVDEPGAGEGPSSETGGSALGADGADDDAADADATRMIAPDADGSVAPTAVVPRPAFDEVTGSYVVQDGPAEMSQSELRVDFGAHLEANYQRLVAQLYAITLSPDQAHSVVQDAYSRAWRNWSIIGRSADPTGWVRRVAVRTTMRSWRHLLSRFGLTRPAPPVAEGLDERTTELLTALRRLSAPERRAVVLFHMAGLSTTEIASVEQVSPTTISSRLDRGRRSVLGGTGDLLSGDIELAGVPLHDDRGYVDEMTMPPADGDAGRIGGAGAHLDDRWERTDTWNGGPDGSWPMSEAPPWETPNSDPWPDPGAREATEGISVSGAQLTSDESRNAAADDDDDRVWNGAPSHDGGVLLDEYDTVAPDGTLVTAAANPPAVERDGPTVSGVRPGGGPGITAREQGTEGDSEDRR
ncbi:RNA polymerase sigma factor [Pseudonocardia sp.]|uniref:RNA polymerase sigma factor n=1 Tax=Pseudonocardia sp. TaxID=60912 RepID=UPI003D14FC29